MKLALILFATLCQAQVPISGTIKTADGQSFSGYVWVQLARPTTTVTGLATVPQRIRVPVTAGSISVSLYTSQYAGSVTFTGTGLNDFSVLTGGFNTATKKNGVTLIRCVQIDSTGTPDTFSYGDTFTSSPTGASCTSTASNIPLTAGTGLSQVIAPGVGVHWGASTGHILGDKWTFALNNNFTSPQVYNVQFYNAQNQAIFSGKWSVPSGGSADVSLLGLLLLGSNF